MIRHGWLSSKFQLHSVVMHVYSNKVASPSGGLVKVSCEESLLLNIVRALNYLSPEALEILGLSGKFFWIVSRSKQSFELTPKK